MKKEITKTTKPKISFTKKDDKEGLVCASCGYVGHGTFDEDTHAQICPDCGANLDEGDLLKFKTPSSYDEDEGILGVKDLDFDDTLLKD